MFAFVLILAFSQENNHSRKGFILMIEASKEIDASSPYHKNPQKIFNLRYRAVEIATKIRFNEKEIRKLAKSKEVVDRVAAAYAIGLSNLSTIDDALFDLLLDDNNIVSIAARESFVYIANDKLNNFLVDQGPPPSANKNKKYEASVLWRIFLSHNRLTHNNYSKEELAALDALMVILRKEWKRNIFREDNKSQLNPEIQKNKRDPDGQENNQDPFPSDLLDPSTYSVKSLYPRKLQLSRNP